MKKIFFILLVIGFQLIAISNPSQDSATIWMEKGNIAYQENKFKVATHEYLKVVEANFESSVLFYNLGNSYFKMGETARALLWYERAKRLEPSNEDIKHNIAFANQKLIDKIEEMPELFIVSWWNAISQLFTSNRWATLSIIFVSIFALSILGILFFKRPVLRNLSFTIAIFTFFFAIFSIIFANKEKSRYEKSPEAIIMASVVNAKSTPTDTGSDIFVIHSGLKVYITDNLNEWVEIKLPNGEKGWVRNTQLEKI